MSCRESREFESQTGVSVWQAELDENLANDQRPAFFKRTRKLGFFACASRNAPAREIAPIGFPPGSPIWVGDEATPDVLTPYSPTACGALEQRRTAPPSALV